MPSESFTATWTMRLFGLFRVPLLAFTTPSVIEIDDNKAVLKIPLNFRTKNHVGVMYFGVLSVGAEAAVGVLAFRAIQASGRKIDFLFKNFKADFLKRAEGDVHFICEDGAQIFELIQKAVQTNERQTAKFRSYAVVPSKSTTEKVAEFELTLSVKRRSQS